MEIRFSVQGNGACPVCIHYHNCEILKKMVEVFHETATGNGDDLIETVIYRCPNYCDHLEEEDGPPYC